jgi:hypothetical protein
MTVGPFQCLFEIQAFFFHMLLCSLDFAFMFFVQSDKQPARDSETTRGGENTAVPAFRFYEKLIARSYN